MVDGFAPQGDGWFVNPWPKWLRHRGRDSPGGPVVKTSSSSAGGVGSIPGRGAKIPHALRPENQNIKQKQYCNKFNKDFKNGPRQKKKKILKTKRHCGRQDNGSPKDVHVLIPGTYEYVTIQGIRHFADGTKFRILRWGDYSVLSKWPLGQGSL